MYPRTSKKKKKFILDPREVVQIGQVWYGTFTALDLAYLDYRSIIRQKPYTVYIKIKWVLQPCWFRVTLSNSWLIGNPWLFTWGGWSPWDWDRSQTGCWLWWHPWRVKNKIWKTSNSSDFNDLSAETKSVLKSRVLNTQIQNIFFK